MYYLALHIYICKPDNKQSTALTANHFCKTFSVWKQRQVAERWVTQCFKNHLCFQNEVTQFRDEFRLLTTKPPDAAANPWKFYWRQAMYV